MYAEHEACQKAQAALSCVHCQYFVSPEHGACLHVQCCLCNSDAEISYVLQPCETQTDSAMSLLAGHVFLYLSTPAGMHQGHLQRLSLAGCLKPLIVDLWPRHGCAFTWARHTILKNQGHLRRMQTSIEARAYVSPSNTYIMTTAVKP